MNRGKLNQVSLLLIIISLTTLSGCGDKGTEPSLADSYMPLKLGNKWYYSSYIHSTPPDSDKITEVLEDVGIRKHRGIDFHIIKRTFPLDAGINPDTIYYASIGDNLYQLVVPGDKPEYVTTAAMFNIKVNGTFNYKSELLDYTVTNLGTDGDKIKFFYDALYAVDEEFTLVYQAGKGLYESLSNAWGVGRRLVRVELK